MPKINLQRIATDEEIKSLALAKGYKETIEKQSFSEITIEKAYAEKKQIFEIIDDKTCKIVEISEIDNPETATEYIAKYYQNLIDTDIKNVFIQIEKDKLNEVRRKEDAELEKTITENVNNSEIIVE